MKKEEKGVAIREKIMFEIKNYLIVHGYAPTIQEIGEAVGLASSASVSHHLAILMQEGQLETDAKIGSSRAMRVKGMRVVFCDQNLGEGKKKVYAGKN